MKRAGVHVPGDAGERNRRVGMLLDEGTGLANLVHAKGSFGLPDRSLAKAGGNSSTHGSNDTGRTMA
jgi:hypothetical protein